MAFRFIPLGLSGLVLIEETRHRDDRGFFAETYRARAFHGGGITDPFVQDNHARSSRGVLRGLHYQLPSGEEGKLLWIPPGFAHGYLVLSETADLTYKVTAECDAGLDRGIRWDDPAIAIVWLAVEPMLSPKDRALPVLAEAENPFVA